MGDAKVYYWIAIGQIIGLVTMAGLRLKLDSADAVLLMTLGVLVLCIFVAKGAGAIPGVLARSITGMIVGAIAGWGVGMIPGLIAAQLTGNTNAMTAYAMVGVVAGVFVGLILNAIANKDIDRTVDALVAGILIGAVVGLIYFRTDYSYYGYIVSLIASMTLGVVVSVVAGAFTGWPITNNIDGIVKGTIVGAIVSVGVVAVIYKFVGVHDGLFMINGIIVGMIVGMIVGVNAAAIGDLYSRAFFRVFSGAFVGGIAGTFLGAIASIIVGRGNSSSIVPIVTDGVLIGILVGAVIGFTIRKVGGNMTTRVFAGTSAGGIAGAAVSVIGFRITDVIVDAILCDMETRNTLVGTPITAIPLVIILMSAIIGCILSIWENARQKRRETRDNGNLSSHTSKACIRSKSEGNSKKWKYTESLLMVLVLSSGKQ